MDDDKQCISVLPWITEGNSSYVAWNNLVSVVSEGNIFIAHWNKRRINIFRAHEEEVRNKTLSTLKSAVQLCQDVTFPELVFQVFEWVGKFFFLTSSGFLKVLNFDESTLRYLKDGKVCFKTIFSLASPKKVLRACPLIRNVLLLSTVLNGYITIDIYNVDTLSDDMEVFLIDSLLLEKQELQDGNASVAMCECNTHVASQLMRAKSDNFIVMLVGLNSGSIYWLPFIKNAPIVPKARRLYQAGRKVLDIINPKGSSKVFVLLNGGVVILITSANIKDGVLDDVESNSTILKFDVIALPGSIREFCIPRDSSSILCTDGTRCWLVKESADETSQTLLPLIGVTGLLALPDSNICLATTKHNTFYAVNVTSDLAFCSEKNTASTQKYCDLETPCQYISELREKTNDLLEVEEALQVEDSVLAGKRSFLFRSVKINEQKHDSVVPLRVLVIALDFLAISAASRGDILQKSFSGRVVVHNVDVQDSFDENTHHTPTDALYKLFIEVKNNSSIGFSPSLWNMCVSVRTRDKGILSKTVPLPNSFVRSYPFSTNIFIRLQGKDLASEPKITVNLIANLPEPDTNRWISIPMIEEKLHLSYFVTVISEAEKGLPETKAVPIDEQITMLVETREPLDRQRTVSYSINIPPHLRNVSALIESLLSNSKHRCEDFLKQIKGGTEQREFNLFFGDAIITLTFNRTISVLTIASNSTEMVHGVKLWIIRTLGSTGGVDSASPEVISKAKWLRSVLEKEQVESSINVGHLKEIHSEIRNKVSAALLF